MGRGLVPRPMIFCLPMMEERRNLHTWGILVSLTASVFLLFVAAGMAGGRSDLLMPLDDVYIHFQYARQFALGEPYSYNPGQSPSSGATSFLYPFILAFGYLAGFNNLNLGLWAMIVGALALLITLWGVYRFLGLLGVPWLWRTTGTVLLGLTGSLTWHFFSGMETGLVVAAMIWVLVGLVERRLLLFLVAAIFLALIRPEGGIMAVFAAASWPFFNYSVALTSRSFWLLLVPGALLLQPVVNWLLTGTFVASGNQAKSLFGLVPQDWTMIIGRIVEQFFRMWWEFATGYSPREGWMLPPGLLLLSIVGLVLLTVSKRWRVIGGLILVWWVTISAAVATLDTAFWHFKRYQVPIMVLFWPLATYALWFMYLRWRTLRSLKIMISTYAAIFGVLLTAQFLFYHYRNVSYVRDQPFAMANWLSTNTSDEAVVAVHDVGLMRYVGQRTTLDIVGLTTPGAAHYWRNGPGSVAEFLIREQPDYIANYGLGHGYGLRLLSQTDLYENKLAEFPVDLEQHLNVALAANSQAIYQPDWSELPLLNRILPSLMGYPRIATGLKAESIHLLNVADTQSELDNNYAYMRLPSFAGFATIVQQQRVMLCLLHDCELLEGGRTAVISESFTTPAQSQYDDVLLLSLVDASEAAQLTYLLGEQIVASRTIPHVPGNFWPLWVRLPVSGSDQETVRIVAGEGQTYTSYAHVFLVGEYRPNQVRRLPWVDFDNGEFSLTDVEWAITDQSLLLSLEWTTYRPVVGDYRLFIHIYDDVNQPPVAQWDGYSMGGPPSNWLVGTFTDRIVLDLAQLSPGRYTLAAGFYDPAKPQHRATVMSEQLVTIADGRVILGIVELDQNG